jgi:hypothetical protein
MSPAGALKELIRPADAAAVAGGGSDAAELRMRRFASRPDLYNAGSKQS